VEARRSSCASIFLCFTSIEEIYGLTALSEQTSKVLVDMVPLNVMPKQVAPLDEQHEFESRRIWSSVTDAINAKKWAAASKAKQTVEQTQRNKAEERKKKGETYVPLRRSARARL
jgi:hypothetical protein